MAQLGGLVMLDPKDQEAKEQFFFGGIEGCRFRRPVVPGDTLVRTNRARDATVESGAAASSAGTRRGPAVRAAAAVGVPQAAASSDI